MGPSRKLLITDGPNVPSFYQMLPSTALYNMADTAREDKQDKQGSERKTEKHTYKRKRM